MTPKSAERPANRLREAAALLDSPEISALFEKVRLTVEKPPAEPPPIEQPEAEPPRTRRASRLTTAALALVVVVTWWCYGPSGSPAMRLTLPGGVRAETVVAGETNLYNGDFFGNENLATLEQLDLLKGGHNPPATNLTAANPSLSVQPIGYAALGNPFTVGLNAPYALWVFNLAVYALCAWHVARLAQTLFGDRDTSKLAAALYVLSIAATVQVGQLGPQLLAVALSFAWILLLVRSELEDRPMTGARLFGLSALLGAWSLVSTSSIFGLVTLAIYLVRKRNLAAVLLPAIAWYAIPEFQHALVASLGLAPSLAHAPTWQPAWQALQTHFANLTTSPVAYAGFLAMQLANFLWNDNPLNLLIGVIGLTFLRHRARWLLWICYLTPPLVSLATLSATAGRGAAVAGNTIVVFAVVAHYALEAGRRLDATVLARLAPVPVLLVLAVQVLWSHSLYPGWVYPAASFETGAFENAGLLGSTAFVRMVGPIEEKPTIAAGRVTAASAYGLDENFGHQPLVPKHRLAPYADHWSGWQTALKSLALQAPIFVCLIAAAFFFLPVRRSLLVTVLLTASLAAAQVWGASTGVDQHVVRQFDERIAVKEDEKLVAQVQLSTEFRELLEQAAKENQQVEFAVRLRGVNDGAKPPHPGSTELVAGQPLSGSTELVEVLQGRGETGVATPAEIHVDEWSSDQQRFAVDASAFLEALKTHRGRVELAIVPKAGTRGVLVHSWQALGSLEPDLTTGTSNGGRQATLVRQDGSIEPLEWFPSFEIRVVRGTNAYPFKPLIERFETARPTGYALVGF